jgi:hypothetical protein
MTKVGRNDPCPCGSGQKFKRCCLIKTKAQQIALPAEVAKAFHDAKIKEKKRFQNYGHVKPVISADFKGYKFIAVGNRRCPTS